MTNETRWGVMTAGLRESLSGEDTTELLENSRLDRTFQ